LLFVTVIVFGAVVVYIFKPKTGFQLCEFISHTKASERARVIRVCMYMYFSGWCNFYAELL